MTTSHELKATERDTTLTPRQLRAAGYVPATIYGKGVASRSLQVRTHELTMLLQQGVREFKLSGFIDCVVKAQQIQRDQVSHKPISIEFMQVDGAAAPKAEKKAAPQKAAKAEAEQPAAEEAAPALEEPETALTGA